MFFNKKFLYTLGILSLSFSLLTGCSKSAKKLNSLGIEAFNNSDYYLAVDNFKEAVDKEPENVEYLINLGMAQLELKDYENAYKSFYVALSLDNTSREAYRGMGMVSYYSGEYSQAIGAFKKIIEQAGENYDDVTLEALQYYASLEIYYQDYAVALDCYDILVKHNFNVPLQRFMMGCIYTAQGMEGEAVLAYEDALKEYGNDYEIYYNIYTNFKSAGFDMRAESYLKRGLDLNSSDNLLKGKTYYILGDYENAKTYLAKASDDGKDEADYYLAMAYEKLGNNQQAEELYKTYIAKYPLDADAYNQFGMYYMNSGKYEMALNIFKQGLALNSESAKKELLYNEACCYEYLYEYKTAYEKFSEYVRLYPDDEAARHEYDFLSSR